MADDTTVVPEPGFTPEPVPDTIADTELNGLQPAEESTDSEPVEPVTEETNDDPQQSPNDDAEEVEDETSVNPEKEPEQPEQKPQEDTEESRRQHNAEMARQRIEAKQQRDYVNEERQKIREYETDLEQKTRNGELDDIEAIKEQQKIIRANQYVDTVERNRNTIVTEAMRAQQEIPLFNPNDKAFQPTLYARALDRFNDSYVVTDPDTNEVIGAQDRNGNNVSLYQYLQQEAASIKDVLASSQRQTQRSESRMRSKAVNPSNQGKVTTSGDELADLLDRIGDTPLI